MEIKSNSSAEHQVEEAQRQYEETLKFACLFLLVTVNKSKHTSLALSSKQLTIF